MLKILNVNPDFQLLNESILFVKSVRNNSLVKATFIIITHQYVNYSCGQYDYKAIKKGHLKKHKY